MFINDPPPERPYLARQRAETLTQNFNGYNFERAVGGCTLLGNLN
jgi:hypothetical protein